MTEWRRPLASAAHPPVLPVEFAADQDGLPGAPSRPGAQTAPQRPVLLLPEAGTSARRTRGLCTSHAPSVAPGTCTARMRPRRGLSQHSEQGANRTPRVRGLSRARRNAPGAAEAAHHTREKQPAFESHLTALHHEQTRPERPMVLKVKHDGTSKIILRFKFRAPRKAQPKKALWLQAVTSAPTMSQTLCVTPASRCWRRALASPSPPGQCSP